VESGFSVVATAGTAETLARHGIDSKVVNKTYEGSWHTVDEMESGGVDLVFNTVAPDPRAIQDSFSMRRVALQRQIPYCTTLPAARASAAAIAAIGKKSIGVRALQIIHAHGADA
jgi:carbamoyl-phosphate synthase large subunit